MAKSKKKATKQPQRNIVKNKPKSRPVQRKPIKKEPVTPKRSTPTRKQTISPAKPFKKTDYKQAIEAYRVMAESSKGKQKKEYQEAIKAFEVMVETVKRPDNFANYRKLRESVSERLKQEGKSTKYINDYTKSLYRKLKKQYEEPASFIQAIRHSDDVVESYFEPELEISGTPKSFPWWNIEDEIINVPDNTYMVIDASEFIPEWLFEGLKQQAVGDIRGTYSIINHELGLEDEERYIDYLTATIVDKRGNKKMVYFLLLDRGRADAYSAINHEELLQEINSRYDLDSAFNRIKGTYSKKKEVSIKKKKTPLKSKKQSKAEIALAMKDFLKQAKDAGFTKKEINAILKNK